ncbi:MAG: amino acid adenylation domain-containing protein [Lachnospiraceae bacterium]|nr:amino acid adenylation domain-containing protein [Lachnospiraceae bacterium]
MKNVLEYMEAALSRNPEKILIADPDSSLTCKEFLHRSRQIGSFLCAELHAFRRPVAVYLDKTPACAAAMMGVVYSGCFYAVLDTAQPADRIRLIFDTLQPAAVLTDRAHQEKAEELGVPVLLLDDALQVSENEPELLRIRRSAIDTDILYVLYTSGSTGTPKGVVINHRAVITYISWVIETFHIDDTIIFGSQTPFYFSMSVTDLFGTLFTGARLQIIPRQYFSFPTMLIDYLNRYEINTIYWVPSALGIITTWDAFAWKLPLHLKKIMFAGEVMPVKYLNYWKKYFPDASFSNLFGPTETTDICTWYTVDRDFRDDESLPIGHSCNNCDSFIVTEDGREAKDGETGELYVRGSFLALGYYNNPEKTADAFVQNPLQSAFPETVYRTGDLVRRNERGEIIYIGRRDFQIKHMGYRIEPGEIETVCSSLKQVDSSVCIYDERTDRILIFYQGKGKPEEIARQLQEKLPPYMCPQKIEKVRQMPYNANGKTDRKYFLEQIRSQSNPAEKI